MPNRAPKRPSAGSTPLAAESFGNLRHIGLNNPASGLPTGPILGQALDQHIAQWKEGDAPIVWLGAEIQRFSDITSAFGPRVSAALQREVAQRLQAVFPDQGPLFHVHANIFGIVLEDGHYDLAVQAAKRLRQIFEAPFVVSDVPIILQAFVGLAGYPNHASDSDSLRQAVAEALRDARENYLPYAIYNSEKHKEQRTNIALMSELKTAIAAGQLELYYQPVVRLEDDECVGFEALTRWHHPVHGDIPPHRFIPAAENTLLIGEITVWTIRTAIEHIRNWHGKGIDLRIGINLSPHDIIRRDIDSVISDLLNYYGVAGECLAFEVTEGALMRAPERALQSLNALRRLGAQIAVDDFGQGYSSLSYLARLPVTVLKIDRSFTLDLDREPKNETIIRASIDLAHDLGMETVVEGVETRALYRRVKEFGSDSAQGYYLARPMPAANVETWLADTGLGEKKPGPATGPLAG